MSVKEKITSTFFWGIVLWLIGYLAGIVLFFVVPKGYIGWVITPFATLLTIWVVMKKIKRPEMMCYFGLGLMWTLIAIILDYIFLVKLFGTGSAYYKTDIFIYYILTFFLPIILGYWKYRHKPKNTELF